MDLLRRTILKGAGASGALAAAVAAGVLKPTGAWASEWNKNAYEAKDLASALKGLGVGAAAESKDIVLKAPEIAENGAVVPVDVVSNIAGTEAISVFVEKNIMPLSGEFVFANGALPVVSLRLKLGQTSDIKVVARAGGKFYTTSREVKVTVGGCGG